MRKVLFTIFACLPLMCMAQNVWEKPQTDTQPDKKEVIKKKQKEINTEDMKYMSGAVPEVNGKVVFTLDLDVPGKNAQKIYDIVYGQLDDMTKASNQFPESAIALVNKRDHIIAARYKEWLFFTNSFISLDRTEFNYTIIATCTDGHLHMTLERISYNYEEGTSTGFKSTAENLITDKKALNKSKTRLVIGTAKFRKKTIDRKDNIFDTISTALK